MSEHDEHEAGPKAADTRPSGLAAALLRTGASLDLETVLNEVVESARALSGARYGAITTIDETGAPQDFVTSGFTEEEHRNMAEWSDGPKLFACTLSLSHGVEADGLKYFVASSGVGGTATSGSDYESFLSGGSATLAVPSRATSATFSVSILDDDLDEDDETITVQWRHTDLYVAEDNLYVAEDSRSIDVTGTITDDDERGVRVSSDSLTVPEGATATYTVVLTSKPTATVTVTPSRSSGSTDVTFSPASLSFTTGNWDTP